MSITYEYSPIISTVVLTLLTFCSIFFVFKPNRIYVFYLVALLLFTGTQYGVEESKEAIKTLYVRGFGQLGVTLINIYLIILFIFSAFFSREKPPARVKDPIVAPLLVIVSLFVLYSAVGMTESITLRNAVSSYGLFNFINLLMFYLILRWSINSESDLLIFERVFFGLCTAMALYGLVRFIAFGGDPANVYLNDANKAVRLTFFDFGQGVLFSILIAYVYFRERYCGTFGLRDFLIALLCMTNIILSSRREGWLGILLVFLWFILTADIKRKILLTIMICVIGAVTVFVSHKRFASGGATTERSEIVKDLTDYKGNMALKTGRFAELYVSILAASKSPILGLGPWGENSELRDPTRERTSTFTHSSYVHMFVKAGLVGLILWVVMLLRYVIWWVRRRRADWNDPRHRAIAEAFFCGFLFWIPDSVFGTPIIIYRHFQILAMLLAIPIIAHVIDKRQEDGNQLAIKAS